MEYRTSLKGTRHVVEDVAAGRARSAGVSHLNSGRNVAGVCVAQEGLDALAVTAAAAAAARRKALDGSSDVSSCHIRGAEVPSRRRLYRSQLQTPAKPP